MRKLTVRARRALPVLFKIHSEFDKLRPQQIVDMLQYVLSPYSYKLLDSEQLYSFKAYLVRHGYDTSWLEAP